MFHKLTLVSLLEAHTMVPDHRLELMEATAPVFEIHIERLLQQVPSLEIEFYLYQLFDIDPN